MTIEQLKEQLTIGKRFEFTNRVNYKVVSHPVTRVSEKSVWTRPTSRESWNTILGYANEFSDFKIV